MLNMSLRGHCCWNPEGILVLNYFIFLRRCGGLVWKWLFPNGFSHVVFDWLQIEISKRSVSLMCCLVGVRCFGQMLNHKACYLSRNRLDSHQSSCAKSIFFFLWSFCANNRVNEMHFNQKNKACVSRKVLQTLFCFLASLMLVVILHVRTHTF